MSALDEFVRYFIYLDEFMNKFNMTQEDVSGKIGKSRSAIANSIRLLSLDEPIRNHLITGAISSGHARALLSLESPEIRMILLENILEKGLNMRQAELLAKQLQTSKPRKAKPVINEQLKVHISQLEDKLSSQLGTKVRLIHSDKKGKIEIDYYGNRSCPRSSSHSSQAGGAAQQGNLRQGIP